MSKSQKIYNFDKQNMWFWNTFGTTYQQNIKNRSFCVKFAELQLFLLGLGSISALLSTIKHY